MSEDEDGGLFCIAISDDEGESKRDRDAQTEEEFQALKTGYTVKIENGEVRAPIVVT